MVIKRNVLVAIIGFLIGLVLALYLNLPNEFALYLGLAGYFVGLLLDHADTQQQIKTYHFRTPNPMHHGFILENHPHAKIIFAARENVTTVILYYRITIKPEDFRLSVVKNLRDFQFRLSERDTQTRVGIELTYPEFNYPAHAQTQSSAYAEVLFDIQEKDRDFKAAIQKVIPGLTLLPDPQVVASAPNLQLAYQPQRDNSPTPPAPSAPPSPPPQYPPTGPERDTPTGLPLTPTAAPAPPPTNLNNSNLFGQGTPDAPSDEATTPMPPVSTSQPSTVTEEEILDDLRGDIPESETTLPDLSTAEADRLPTSNVKAFETFLDTDPSQETPPPDDADQSIPAPSIDDPPSAASEEAPVPDDIPIDFSAVGSPSAPEEEGLSDSRDRFNEDIIAKFDNFHQKKTN